MNILENGGYIPMIRPMIVFWLPYYSIFQTKPHRGGLKWFEHVGQAVQPQVPFRVVSNKLQTHWLKMELSHWYGKKGTAWIWHFSGRCHPQKRFDMLHDWVIFLATSGIVCKMFTNHNSTKQIQINQFSDQVLILYPFDPYDYLNH